MAEVLRTLALVGAIALLAAASASAAGGTTATLSNSSPSANRVALTIVLQDVVLRCGRTDIHSLSVVLPHAMHVPRSIAPADVRLGAQQAASVQTNGSTIELSLPSASSGVMCDLLVLGTTRLQISRAAGLGNPARAGTYAFTVEAKPRGEVWHGSLVVRR